MKIECGECGEWKDCLLFGRKSCGTGWIGTALGVGSGSVGVESEFDAGVEFEAEFNRNEWGLYCLQCNRSRGLGDGRPSGFSGRKLMRARDTVKRGGWGLGVRRREEDGGWKGGFAKGLGHKLLGTPHGGAISEDMKCLAIGEKKYGYGGGDPAGYVDLDVSSGRRGERV